MPRWGRVGLGLLLVWALVCRLVYGSVGLDENRFWDERYSLENVRHILETGRLEPVSGWYPMPSYLPHAALLAAVRAVGEVASREDLAVLRPRGFTPLAYLACRSLQSVFGTASLALLFLLVRRVGDWREALLATLLLAATPNHLRLSVIVKPDALLLCTTLLAVIVAVRLAERRRPGPGDGVSVRFLWCSVVAGGAVALAASTSLIGVLAAVPVVLAVLLGGCVWHERLGALAAAGLSSAALFFAANPAWRLQLEFLERIRRQYREQSVGHGHLDVLIGEIQALLRPAFFGVLLGALGLLGLVALVGAGLRDADRRRALVVAASFPIGFSTLFAASTTYAKENHFLHVAPYVAWGAAYALLQGVDLLWRVGEEAGGRRWVRPAVVTVALAGILWLAGGASRLVYETRVPTTASLLARQMRPRLDPLAWRLVYVETIRDGPLPLVRWRDRAATRQVVSLLEVPEEALYLSDGVVVPEDRLEGPRGTEVPPLLDRLGSGERLASRPRFGRARGPALVAVLRPWRSTGEVALPMSQSSAGTWTATLPGEGGEVRSLRLWLPRFAEPPSLELDGRELTLYSTRTEGRKDRYLSVRFRTGEAMQVRLRLPVAADLETEPVLEVRTWVQSD